MRALLDNRGPPPAAGVPPDRAIRDLVDDALRALLCAAETLPIDAADIDTMFQTLSEGVRRSEASDPGFLHDAYPASRLIVDTKWHRGEYGPGQLEPEIRRHHILRLEAERTIRDDLVRGARRLCKEALLVRLGDGSLVASAIVEGDAFATRQDLPAEVWSEWQIDDVEKARTYINGERLRAILIRPAVAAAPSRRGAKQGKHPANGDTQRGPAVEQVMQLIDAGQHRSVRAALLAVVAVPPGRNPGDVIRPYQEQIRRKHPQWYAAHVRKGES